ncbi:MAG: cytochrome c3 family protein [Planctomycetes bacterium]|nr:cytochrome c3 family protein [Planctomycetota bacterium]
MTRHLPLAAIYGYFGAMVLGMLGLRYYASTHATNTEQPIPTFSHEVHVGKNKIACSTCHEFTNLADGKLARRPGIPSVQKCMECHIDTKDKPGFQLLHGFYERRESIVWNRIHTLPGHVYFPHHRHIRALAEKQELKLSQTDDSGYIKHDEKGVALGEAEGQAKLCANCHGEVKYMSKIRQVRSLSMGWCVSCHRENNASIDCLTCHQ